MPPRAKTASPSGRGGATSAAKIKAKTVAVGAKTADEVELKVLDDRFRNVLEDNDILIREIAKVSEELEMSRAQEEELSASWKATVMASLRQKHAVQGSMRNLQNAQRIATNLQLEDAKHIQELQDVLQRLQSVNRQLEFAEKVQHEALVDIEHRSTARANRVQKVKRAIYKILYQAQQDGGLEEVCADLLNRSGTLVRSVVAREAQREALELSTTVEEGDDAPPVVGQLSQSSNHNT
mmetsp:Transcript_17579/g.26552  ORF Transcript_17579/g.26552 Transcript_17579/m.26552 type:complete len:238 (+) Transcript_17579:86-799(+)